jgi:lipopolysaccharide transport system permease protein
MDDKLAQNYLAQKFPVLRYRSLIVSLAISDLKLRYRNSVLGFLWSFLEPLLMLGVLYLVFTTLLGSKIQYYPLYILEGMILWNMFSRATQMSLSSFIIRSGLVSKVYFPREILPIASCITSFIMMSFEFGVFGVFMVFFKFIPPITILYLPFVLVIMFVVSLGIALPLSVSNIYFRDVQYIWGIFLQAGFFITPIIFSLQIYPASIRNILYYNPVTNLIETAHNVTLYGLPPSISEILYPILVSFLILGVGYAIFRKFETKAVELL